MSTNIGDRPGAPSRRVLARGLGSRQSEEQPAADDLEAAMGDAADVTPGVTDLRLVAVTPERSHLVLEDDDRHQFRVPVDERLANALRSPERARPDGPRRDG